MEQKLTLKRRIDTTIRGLGILNKYCPGLIRDKTLHILISTLQPFCNIWLSAHIINELSATRNVQRIILFAVSIVIINFVSTLIMNLLNKVCVEKEAQMWSYFQKIFSDKQVSMDYVDLENAKIQHQKNQAAEDLFMFGNGLSQLVWSTNGLVKSVVNITVSIAMIITMFTAKANNSIIDSPIWASVILLSIIIGGIYNLMAYEKENKVFEQWCQDTVWFNRVFMFYGWDVYSSTERAKDLRIYQQNILADKVLARMLCKDKKGDKHIFKMASYQAIAVLLSSIVNAACYLFVVLKAFLGAFGVGSIVQYVSALGRLNEGMREFMFTLSDNKVCCLHLCGLFNFLDIPNRQQGKESIRISDTEEYCIEFSNVSFKYPETKRYALKNLSLTINNKQSLAIVGMNGSGKSTMVKLLCRLYDPTEGEILLNGVNIQEFDYEEYKRILSVVFQDFKLLAFPLGQNIAVSDDFDEERVIESLKRVGFMERFASMPKGLDTPLYKDFEETGVEISGGEAQKIALARALYRDSPIVVLDEPTAALDPIAELEIYSMFHKLIENKTAIYISHRLSSCKFCDKVAVFHEGKLVQYDSHEKLLEDKNGKYSELWEAQLQYYRL